MASTFLSERGWNSKEVRNLRDTRFTLPRMLNDKRMQCEAMQVLPLAGNVLQ